MAESRSEFPLRVNYNTEDDTLTFTFTPTPEPGIAEEAADEVWVRYEPESRRVLTVDVLNFSKHVQETFGPSLTYTERTDPDRLEALVGFPLTPDN